MLPDVPLHYGGRALSGLQPAIQFSARRQVVPVGLIAIVPSSQRSGVLPQQRVECAVGPHQPSVQVDVRHAHAVLPEERAELLPVRVELPLGHSERGFHARHLALEVQRVSLSCGQLNAESGELLALDAQRLGQPVALAARRLGALLQHVDLHVPGGQRRHHIALSGTMVAELRLLR